MRRVAATLAADADIASQLQPSPPPVEGAALAEQGA